MDFASLIFRHACDALEHSNEKELQQVLLWTPWIVHRHDHFGWTLLHHACSERVWLLHPEKRRSNIKLLLTAGADPLASFLDGEKHTTPADICDTHGYDDDSNFLRGYIAKGMWNRSDHPRETGCCNKDYKRV